MIIIRDVSLKYDHAIFDIYGYIEWSQPLLSNNVLLADTFHQNDNYIYSLLFCICYNIWEIENICQGVWHLVSNIVEIMTVWKPQ